MTTEKQAAIAAIEEKADLVAQVADQIWSFAELSLQEEQSAALYCRVLEQEGFTVEKGICNIPTAFSATYGSGRPIIGFLAEYDALSGLSQKAGCTEPREHIPGGCGHGCGHNMLGAGAMAAACAVKEYLQDMGPGHGTVIFFGCPGEEGGAAKSFYARDHVFDGVDIALTWHPGDTNGVQSGSSNSCIQTQYHFTGVAAHAAGDPDRGRSALDAVELMNVGVQFLREHMPPKTQIQYAFLDAGGPAANVVQSHAELAYILRAPRIIELPELFERVNKIARGAAMMTETQVDIQVTSDCADVVLNSVVTGVLRENALAYYPIRRTDEEKAYAAKFAQLATPQGKALQHARARRTYDGSDPDEPTADVYSFLAKDNKEFAICSDIGDVSYVVPLSYMMITTVPTGLPNHTWQTVTVGKSPIMHTAVLTAGKCLGATGADFLLHPEKAAAARAELDEVTREQGYPYPLPADLKPAIP